MAQKDQCAEDGCSCSLQRCLERSRTCLLVERLAGRVGSSWDCCFFLVMEKNPNWKMEYRLELMVLLVFLTTTSSVAQSREEFTEAVVRNCTHAEKFIQQIAKKYFFCASCKYVLEANT